MSVTPIEIDIHSVKRMLTAGDDFALIDCRENDEYEIANIAGATLLPMSELAQRIGELSDALSKPLVVHCHHGGRSLRVANWLRSNGFPQAQSMAGGIDQWSLEIDPTVARY